MKNKELETKALRATQQALELFESNDADSANLDVCVGEVNFTIYIAKKGLHNDEG